MNATVACYTCHNPSRGITGKSKWAFGKVYCSDRCKNADNAVILVYSGLILVMVAVYSLMETYSGGSMFMFLLGCVPMLFGLYLRNMKMPSLEIEETGSEVDRYINLSTFIVYWGIMLQVVSMIFLIFVFSNSIRGIFFFGFGIMALGLFTRRNYSRNKIASRQHVTASENRLIDFSEPEIDPNLEDNEKGPQDQLVYSSILQAEVHPCCHQSARLKDQYCACGRALEYPAET